MIGIAALLGYAVLVCALCLGGFVMVERRFRDMDERIARLSAQIAAWKQERVAAEEKLGDAIAQTNANVEKLVGVLEDVFAPIDMGVAAKKKK